MTKTEHVDAISAATCTAVTLELDETLRDIRDSDADAGRILIEGLRSAADLFELCLLITPWTVTATRRMLRELEDVTWERLAVAGQLGAELKPRGAAVPVREVAEFYEDERNQAVDDFVAARWRAPSGESSAGVQYLHRGAIHTFTWDARGKNLGHRLEREARGAGLTTVSGTPGGLHVLPAPVETVDIALAMIHEASVDTVVAITDAKPGMRLRWRLREESELANVISVAVAPLQAAPGQFSATVNGARELGELLLTFARTGRIDDNRHE